MSPERPVPKDPRLADQERVQRLAGATHLIAPEGDMPLFELDDFSESPETAPAVERRGRKQKPGFEWLQGVLGEKWWQRLGVEDDETPGNLRTTQAILEFLGLPIDSGRMTAIIEGWLEGDGARVIAMSHKDIPSAKFVTNKISALKARLSRLARKEERESAEVHIGRRAQDWLTDTYGIQWWKKFGFESEQTVIIESLVSELFSRLKVATPEPGLQAQFAEWVGGKSLVAIAGPQKSSTPLAKAVKEIKDELADTERAARAEQVKAVERRIPSDIGRRTVATSVQVVSQEKSREPQLADKWAERLGLNEKMTRDLSRYLNPNGSTLIDKEMYQAVRHLTEYLAQWFGTLGNEDIDISDDQRDMLREVLGFDRNERTKRPGMPTYQTVSRFIRDFPQLIYGFMPERERAIQVLSAFQAVLDADTERLARTQQG